MANFISSLTGQQLNDALTQVNQRVPEGWAVGERDGIPVSSSSPYYQNNAKYYADYAQGQAERAEAAVPVGTAGAVFFDRVQTLTEGQKAQARQNIQAGGTNPNLLDNPWFTVNQRGFTTSSETNGIYSVDRWLINSGKGTQTLSADGMLLDNTNGSAQTTFQQNLERDLTGQTVTLSVLDGNGNLYTGMGTIPAQTSGYVEAFRVGIPGGRVTFQTRPSGNPSPGQIQFYIGAGNSFKIRAVKLELGSVSTLANDAPPNYAEELAKCQRYFIRYKSPNYMHLAIGFAMSKTVLNFTLVNSLRAGARTVTFSNLTVANATTSYAVTNLTASVQDEGLTRLQAVVASGLTYGNLYAIQLNPDGYIDISADL